MAAQDWNIEPLNDRVLVERCDYEEMTPGGLVIPDMAKEKPTEGLVIASGPGRTDDDGRLVPTGLAPGDRVLFGRYSGIELKVGEKNVVMLRADDVIARLTEKQGARKKRGG